MLEHPRYFPSSMEMDNFSGINVYYSRNIEKKAFS